MRTLTLIFATLALSTVAFSATIIITGPPPPFLSIFPDPGLQDWLYQIGYAANLNIGDSVLNISNDGTQGGFLPNTLGVGNICVNVYTFDPQEEEIACCACLVTPNGLNSLSVKSDLVSNPLTPAIPTSVVVKLVSSQPAADITGNRVVCNPTLTVNNAITVESGMLAWGTTLEPAGTPGTYSPVNVPYLSGVLAGSELVALTSTCNFIQGDGTGFGICKSCRLGALSGSKK